MMREIKKMKDDGILHAKGSHIKLSPANGKAY